jgi:predicted glycosyltransferase
MIGRPSRRSPLNLDREDGLIRMNALASAKGLGRSAPGARVWLDIDNPPQVQYLVPVAEELGRRGCAVLVTARDNSITHGLLRQRGTDFLPVGHAFGKQKASKVIGVIGRALRLVRRLRPFRPELVIAASRSAALAARLLGIPCFIICDYEHAELRSYTWLRSFIVFPEVIPAQVFRQKGFRADRLLTFPGIKEHLTFHGRDLSAIPAWQAPEPERVIVAFRPPAAETHYYSTKSNRLYSALLQHLAVQEGILLLFLPRYPWQVEHLRQLQWSSPWLVPEEPIPAIPLLKGVDLVISSGGTMLREACYLGVPAYSIFQSSIGAVDLHLQAEGKLELLAGPEDFGRLRLVKRSTVAPPMAADETMDQLLSQVLDPRHRRNGGGGDG